jgi:hypothetical protein
MAESVLCRGSQTVGPAPPGGDAVVPLGASCFREGHIYFE